MHALPFLGRPDGRGFWSETLDVRVVYLPPAVGCRPRGLLAARRIAEQVKAGVPAGTVPGGLAGLVEDIGEGEYASFAVGSQLEPHDLLSPPQLHPRWRVEGQHLAVHGWSLVVPEREMQRRARRALPIDRGREPGGDVLRLGKRAPDTLRRMGEPPGEPQRQPAVEALQLPVIVRVHCSRACHLVISSIHV